jgi:alpha-D-ribose 1-methylphosphonate 5-triphosphate diphosphatase
VTDIFIERGRALLGGEILETSLQIAGGKINAVDSGHGHGSLGIDARDLLVLPGIVDLHGDAFERQMMPRPGVDFPVDVALVDSDRQAIGNGITTVFHATTWSWEPGLRSAENARDLLEAIETMRPQLVADTRFHLRHETYNLDAAGSSPAELTKYQAKSLVYMARTETSRRRFFSVRSMSRFPEQLD